MGSKYSTVFSTNNGELLMSADNNYCWKHKNQTTDCRVTVTLHKNEMLDNVILVHDGKSYNFKWVDYNTEYCFILDYYNRGDDKILSRKEASFIDYHEEKQYKFIFNPNTVKIYTIDADNVSFSFAVIFLPLILNSSEKIYCE